MPAHSSILAWRVPWMEEPCRLQSMRLQSRIRLSDFTFTFHFHALQKEMTTYSNVLAWRIPGMGEPGGLPSMGSHRVGHDWSNLAAAAAVAENKEGLKSLLMKVKEESEKAGLKFNIQKTKIMASSSTYHFMANRWRNNGNSDRLYFLGLQNYCGWWLQPWNEKMLAPWKESYDKPRQCIEKERYHFADKGPHIQIYGFSSSHVWIWELGHKEGWAVKNWCFLTGVLEKTLESPLDWKEIKQINSKGNQPWIFIGRTDALILWPPMQRTSSLEKTMMLRKIEGRRRRGWRRVRWLDGTTNLMDMSLSKLWEIVKDREGSLMCCSPWGHKKYDISEWLNNNNINNNKMSIKLPNFPDL